MFSKVFLNDDYWNIYHENDIEVIDIINEEGDPYPLKQLANHQSYHKKNLGSSSYITKYNEPDKKMEEILLKKNVICLSKYNDYGLASR